MPDNREPETKGQPCDCLGCQMTRLVASHAGLRCEQGRSDEMIDDIINALALVLGNMLVSASRRDTRIMLEELHRRTASAKVALEAAELAGKPAGTMH